MTYLYAIGYAMYKILRSIYHILFKLFFRSGFETRRTACPITFQGLFFQKVLGINRQAYWPVHFSSTVTGVKNIYIGIESGPGASPGCYIQGIGKIHIGDYTLVAANVGIISANHDVYDHRIHKEGSVRIGSYCWIGMNAVILPGVELGDFTIVGAGAVVTKSFHDGYCIIGGNPAQLISKLDPEKCVRYHSKYEYYGYYSKKKFEKKFSHLIKV
jgi:acetyltransferase-like isoleucine patch superfamily enzyme